MDTIKPSDKIDHRRRRFFGTAGMTIAAAQFAITGAAKAQPGETKPAVPATRPETNTSFAALKQIDAGLLNVGYAEAGPADGPPSFFCTAGPTTYIVSSMSCLCWRGPATA
jgi:hypothetical protein